MDKLLLAGVMAMRLLDAQSTHSMLARGNREQILPAAIAQHQPAMYAYSIGAGALETVAIIVLKRHNHQRLARMLAIADMATSAAVVAHNESLGTVRKGK